MWILLAFLSASLLGCYDVCKKHALGQNSVIPVLFLNTLFSSLIFLPMAFHTPFGGWEVQKFIVLKSCIVLSSWALGYCGIKHLPITLVGRLNAYQWVGVLLAIISFFMLSRSGKREGIDFRHDRWIFCIIMAAILGAVSGLYDKYLMASVENGGAGLPPLTVQCWYNFYQALMMGSVLLFYWWPQRHTQTAFSWKWSIPLISIFLCAADFVYFYALSMDGSLVSVVSMIRRGSVLVSFLVGAFVFREKNLRSKAIDLLLVLLGMVFLYIGSTR